MIKLEFPLNICLHSTRPIFRGLINGKAITCMLDTGADIPVYCKGLDLFKDWTRSIDNVSFFKSYSIGGFGKGSEESELYNVPKFELSDGNNAITYHNMKIAVVSKPRIPCDLILSASLFMKMRYTIDCLNSHNSLVIEADKNLYGVGFYPNKETIYIFTEDIGEIVEE